MRVFCCDICGKLLTNNELNKRNKTISMSDPGGYFTPAYRKARVNKKGEVVEHVWGDQLELCSDCFEFMNIKIWEALHERQKIVPKSRTIKITVPFSGEVLPEMYEEPIGCTCNG